MIDSRRAVRVELTAFPLTPIHVGAGAKLTPEDYVLDGDSLVRFDAPRVLAEMDAAARRRFAIALDGGRLTEARRELAEAVDPGRHGIERIVLGAGARTELADAVKNPLHRGEVAVFARSGGRPFLPGSSIKGALRTAVVSRFAGERKDAVRKAIEAGGDHRARALEDAALLREANGTETDPLRFLSVADAFPPADAMRVDKVEILQRRRGRGKAGGESAVPKIRMYFERLLSSADEVSFKPADRFAKVRFPIEIAVDEARQDAIAGLAADGGRPRCRLDFETVWEAARTFYWARWRADMERFFAGEPRSQKYMERLLRSIKVDSRTLADTGPVPNGRYILVRVGRFSHFESLSVDEFRQGWNPQARRPIAEGATRSVVRIGKDGAPVPFGWLLLLREKTQP